MWFSRTLVTLTCALMFATIGLAQTPPPGPNQRTVDVTGHGDANAKPDTLIISFAIDNQAPTADECTRAHAERVRKVIDTLKDKLGADTKIETSDYSLNPNITYVNLAAPALPPPESPTGAWDFKADLTANSDSLDMTGKLVDVGMAAGATRFVGSGVTEVPFVRTPVSSIYVGPGSDRPPRQMAFVTLEVEEHGESASDAARRGGSRATQVQKALAAQLDGKGAVEISEFNITQTASGSKSPLMTPTPQAMAMQHRHPRLCRAFDGHRRDLEAEAAWPRGPARHR